MCHLSAVQKSNWNSDFSPFERSSVSIISRMLLLWNRAAKVVLKSVALLLPTVLLVIALALTYSTAHGYMTWWVWSRGSVSVRGVSSGYLHVNWKHPMVIITRTDLHPSQSYLVWIGEKNTLIHCGEWHAPRVPVFPIGDVNPPCSIFSNRDDMPSADDPVASTLTARPGFVKFQTVQGNRVVASW
jgi:hypothetical protein